MALFLQNHSVAKIMILGHWLSDNFLVYICPQVIKWTNNMSTDMLKLDSYHNAPPQDMQPHNATAMRKPLNGHNHHLYHTSLYLLH